MRKQTIIITSFFVAIFSIIGYFFATNTNTSSALTTAGFSAGNIMSDYVMSNKSAMSEAQIQAFLKSKNSCNDNDYGKYQTYTAKGYQYSWNGHFVCMADESFGGKSAANIIWRAAQDYSINPQVLIVLLEKEQGLVTDTWPNWNHQYAAATGFDCPDSGSGCNNANAGFENQIRKAANLFHEVLTGGWSNYPVGVNYIKFNQDASCGGTNVNIENRATSALYRYTPYQPNQHALSGGSTSSYPSCGAFGNRNFYSYFTEWFGSTRVYVSPTGVVDSVAYSDNKIKVAGWAFDGDDSTKSIEIHVYVGGPAGTAGVEGRAITADQNSPDVNSVYKIAGKHRFNASFATAKTGIIPVFIYGINIGSGTNVEIGKKTILIINNQGSSQLSIYRLYNPYSGYHHYTMSSSEAQAIVNLGWIFEGGNLKSAGLGKDCPVGTNKIYRGYLPGVGVHHWTQSSSEISTMVKNGWANEGVGWCSNAATTGAPVYRAYNPNSGEHLYTTSNSEYKSITTQGWKAEGIAWYQ